MVIALLPDRPNHKSFWNLEPVMPSDFRGHFSTGATADAAAFTSDMQALASYRTRATRTLAAAVVNPQFLRNSFNPSTGLSECAAKSF